MKKLRLLLLKLLGYPEQATEGNTGQSKSPSEGQIDKTIENFLNRPIHKTLTEEIIDTTSNDQLLQVVYDNLVEKLPKDYSQEYQTVLSWTKSRQAIYQIWNLEAEVNNGGYNQFYFNSSGQFHKLLSDSLKLIGANRFADLMERANKAYEQENENITKEQDGTLEGLSKSYEDNPLDKFDDEFYDLYKTENLQQIQVDYIRKHKMEFVDKDPNGK